MALKKIGASPVLRGLGRLASKIGLVKTVTKEIHHHHDDSDIQESRKPARRGMNGIGLYGGLSYWNAIRRNRIDGRGIWDIQEGAYKAWLSHPVIKKAIRLKRVFACQEGFKMEPKVANEDIQKWLDAHWKINWKDKVEKRYESWLVYGELAFHVPRVNAINGHYEIGQIDRCYIEEVVASPLNMERPEWLRTSQNMEIWEDGQKRFQDIFHVVRFDWLEEKFKGEVLYLSKNILDGDMRGVSDLLPVLDWLDLFDQVMWTEGARIKLLRSMLYHLRLDTTDDDYVENKRKEISNNPPEPGEVYVSNMSEELEVLSPNLNAQDTLKYIEFLLGLIAGTLDMPEHYFYSANTVSKSSAQEMGAPVYASVRNDKKNFCEFMAMEAQLALQKACEVKGSVPWKVKNAISKDKLKPEVLEVEISSRDPERDSYEVIGRDLLALGKSLSLARAEGWMDLAQTGKLFRQAASARGLGEIEEPDFSSEAKMEQSLLKSLETKRPQLKDEFPLAPGGFSKWAVNGRGEVRDKEALAVASS